VDFFFAFKNLSLFKKAKVTVIRKRRLKESELSQKKNSSFFLPCWKMGFKVLEEHKQHGK